MSSNKIFKAITKDKLERNPSRNPLKRVFKITDENESKLDKITTGSWSKEEHEKFLEGMRKYGNSWKKLEAYIETRTRIQIRSHWQKYCNSIHKKAIEDANKNEDKKMFVVFHAYRSTTLNAKSSHRLLLDVEPELNGNKPHSQEKRKCEAVSKDSDYLSHRKAPETNSSYDDNIYLSNGYNSESKKLFVQASDFSGFEDFWYEEFGLFSTGFKRDDDFQMNSTENYEPNKLMRITYDV